MGDGVDLGARRFTGLVPCLEGQSRGNRAVEVGIRLEVQPCIAVIGEQESAGDADGAEALPGATAIQRVVPGALAGDDSGDCNAFESAAIHIADASSQLSDQMTNHPAGQSSVFAHTEAEGGIGKYGRSIDGVVVCNSRSS
ncbi:hypothetical protein D3C78_1335690 [compost metagenome]